MKPEDFACEFCASTGYQDYPSCRKPCPIPGHTELHHALVRGIIGVMQGGGDPLARSDSTENEAIDEANNWRTVSPYMTEDEAWNELADLEMLGIHYNLEEKMTGQIILTREEVREAIEVGCFFGHDPERYECTHFVERGDSICTLCKKLTEFAEGGDEEIEREEREMAMADKYDTICLKCNGLIARPGVTYGYSGDFCCCPDEDATLDGVEKDIEEAVKEVREEYADYAKQEIRFCPYCGAALGMRE